MARRYRYRRYRTNRHRRNRPGRNRRARYIVLALIVLVMVLVISKSRRKKPPVESAPKETAVVVDPVGGDRSRSSSRQPQAEAVADTEPPQRAPIVPVGVSDTDTTSPGAMALIKEALGDVGANEIIAARDKLNRAMALDLSPQIREGVKTKLQALSEKWLFSRDVYPGDTLTELYEVQSGDLFSEIGKQYKVPYEILMDINRIERPELLRAGRKIKVINGPFHVIVHRSTFTLDLYLGNNNYVKSYRVGLGRVGKDTPTGRWRVRRNDKLIQPTWTNPETGRTYVADDPDYPLGSRWIGIEGLEGNAKGRTGFAFHGTKEPEAIGTRSSLGCIRLYNGNVIELYNLLTPVLSEVRIVD